MAFVKVDTPEQGGAVFYFQRPYSQPREISWMRYLLIIGLASTLLSLFNTIGQARSIGNASNESTGQLYLQWPYEVDMTIQGRHLYCEEDPRDCRQNDLTTLSGDWGDRTITGTVYLPQPEDGTPISRWDVEEQELENYPLNYQLSETEQALYIAGDITRMLKVTAAFVVTAMFLAILYIIGRYIFLIWRLNSGFPHVYHKILRLAGLQIVVEILIALYASRVDQGVYTLEVNYAFRPAVLLAVGMIAIALLPNVRNYFSPYKIESFDGETSGGGPVQTAPSWQASGAPTGVTAPASAPAAAGPQAQPAPVAQAAPQPQWGQPGAAPPAEGPAWSGGAPPADAAPTVIDNGEPPAT